MPYDVCFFAPSLTFPVFFSIRINNKKSVYSLIMRVFRIAEILNMKKFILILLIGAALASCDSGEKLIDNTSKDWQILYSTAEPPYALTLAKFPSGEIVVGDVYSQRIGESLPAPVENIVTYRGAIFAFIPEANRLDVLDAEDFRVLARLDYSESGAKPADVCFHPGGTSAYVALGASSSVTLLDLTNYQVAKHIFVGENPVDVECVGNKIFTTNQTGNSVSMIDSRVNIETGRRFVHDGAPSLIATTPNGEELIVIALGAGKVDSSEKTAAKVLYYNAETLDFITSFDLAYGATLAVDAFPKGMAVSPKDWCFVTSDNYLYRIDLRARTGITAVNSIPGTRIIYNNKRDEMLLLRGIDRIDEIVAADAVTGKLISVLKLDKAVAAAYPY